MRQESERKREGEREIVEEEERDRPRRFCAAFCNSLSVVSLDVDSSLLAVLERPDVPMAQRRSVPVRPLLRVRGSCRTRRPVCAVGRSKGAAECTPTSGVPRDVARWCGRGQPAGTSRREKFCTDKWHYTIVGAPGHGRSAAGDLSTEGGLQYEIQRR